MSEESDDRKATAELNELKSEAIYEAWRGNLPAADRAAEELLFKSLENGSAHPDPICARIQRELERDPMQYRSLLDVWDGNTRRAAEMARDHMIELGRLGREWSMHRAMAHLDSLATRLVTR